MNELKPEDVMRALELYVQRHLMPNVDIDGTVRVEDAERWFLKLLEEQLAPYITALLREKDAKIAEFQSIAEFQQSSNMKRWFELQEKDDQLAEKDAEIERLTSNMNGYAFTAQTLSKEFEDYRADVQMEIADARAEAITEFSKRMEKTLTAQVNVSRNEMLAAFMWCLDLVKNVENQLKGATDGEIDL